MKTLKQIERKRENLIQQISNIESGICKGNVLFPKILLSQRKRYYIQVNLLNWILK
jgi:hypothetical protein